MPVNRAAGLVNPEVPIYSQAKHDCLETQPFNMRHISHTAVVGRVVSRREGSRCVGPAID